MKNSGEARIAAWFKLIILFGGLLTACQVADAQRGLVSFEKNVLDGEIRGGYGVEVADVDGDGLTDIVALATNPGQFVWYKNPSWDKFAISTVVRGNVDAAPHDIDDDGDIDMVLANSFNLSASSDGGPIHWLENPGNPTVNQEWEMHFIDEVPTSHRVEWGDINGDGEQELINLPIIGIGATSPEYDANLQLKAYSIPGNLSVDRWPGIVLDESLQLSHGLSLVDWDADGREDILTASFYGVHLFQLATQGRSVARRLIGIGKQEAERPAIGSSEVDVGELQDGSRYIATIEPWHGNEVVVYVDGANELWDRLVIESGLANGHALLTADLDNDGSDEIVAGCRSEPYQLVIYKKPDTDSEWNRIELDSGGIAVSGLAIDDLNGDGFADIVGIGSGTENLVYYENSGP
ncbi:MAG: VCBS repeat-containing protein [Gammaproteobacteria bacterium]|nr:VCBS repeat-containing protein [Gammaproteobacteria bacterium]MDP6733249.1 VCBS repeat-containing protein [Gammaproteobacteria bacterium]